MEIKDNDDTGGEAKRSFHKATPLRGKLTGLYSSNDPVQAFLEMDMIVDVVEDTTPPL
jgi:hypothetical protein